jgi:AcrR family transcriptional regulator
VDNAEQIRAVATQLFASVGYEGASLQAIAERVGVTKQTLLYHYPSKEALRRAVFDQVFAHFRERLPQMLEAVTSGHGRFEALTRELLQFLETDPDRARLLLRELLDNPDGMRKLLAENLRPWILLIAQYIRQGQASGVIRADVDPEAYVLQVTVLVLANVAARSIAAGVLAGDPAALASGDGGGPAASYTRQLRELFRISRTALFQREDRSTEREDTSP